MCIGETFFWLAGASLGSFFFAGAIHFAWKSKLFDDSYKRFRLRTLYAIAIMAMAGAILSVLWGTDC